MYQINLYFIKYASFLKGLKGEKGRQGNPGLQVLLK